MTKAELHKLVDELPDGAVDGAGVLLRGIIIGPIDPRSGLVSDSAVAGR